MIGIISRNASFCQTFQRGLAALGVGEVVSLHADAPDLEEQLRPVSRLVVDAHWAFGPTPEDGRSSWAERLRLCFKGPILFLGFAPRERVRREPGGYLLDTPGCAFGQLPLTLAELRRLLETAIPPTPSEWERVSRTIRYRELADQASSLGHYYENIFSPALSSLRELEKLGSLPVPDRQRVGKEIQVVHGRLTEERLSRFLADLGTLLAKAADLDLPETPDARVALIRQCLPLLSLDEEGRNREDFLRAVRNIRSALKELLAFMAAIKEKAVGEVEGGGENPFRR
jgi:hypothetical protein